MYKVMIVEDEMFVRIGLEHAVVWEDYGLQLMPSASNGREALELYHKYKPNLIITDVKMPEMGGIELISAIRAENKDIRFIVLTCMEDYKTAKEALNLSVSHYFTKCDLDIDELKEYLTEIVNELSAVVSRTESLEPIDNAAALTRQRWAEFFFDGKMYDIDKLLSSSYIPKGVHYLVQLSFELPEEMKNESSYLSSILNLLKEVIEKQKSGKVLTARRQRVIIIYSFSDETEAEQLRRMVLFKRHLEQSMKSYFNLSLNIASSCAFDSFDALAQRWQELQENEVCSNAQALEVEPLTDTRVLLAIDYIREHLSESLTLATVAEHTNFSPGYLGALFKRELNVFFGDFVLNMRIKKAKLLLTQSDEKLYAISEEVGFSDVSYFVKVFKRITGMTPNEYRRKNTIVL